MSNYTNLPFHPIVEKLTDVLCTKTQNTDRQFFRLVASYFMSKTATMMRAQVKLPGGELMPTNTFVISLAPSGYGKSYSVHLLGDKIMEKFQTIYRNSTEPELAEKTIARQAITKSRRNKTRQDEEEADLIYEYEQCGELLFSFDSATPAAVKQLRSKLLLSGTGSMNMEIDEIGSNLLGQTDVLNQFIELWDLGRIKQKLVKNTIENRRNTSLSGSTPGNMMLFGTPVKLLNGGKTETEFNDMMGIGYARRCFFGFAEHRSSINDLSVDEIYDMATDQSMNTYLNAVQEDWAKLAEPVNHGRILEMTETVAKHLIGYRKYCAQRASNISDYQEVQKLEMEHRHSKVVKQAAAYAFMDNSLQVTVDHIDYAIALAEESGEAMYRILNRDQPHVRLAHYICSIPTRMTAHQLMHELPFFKGSESARREMLNLGIAYAFENNMVITKEKVGDVEFIHGKSLPETDLNNLIMSYSKDLAYDYDNRTGKWDNIEKVCTAPGIHWCTHHFLEDNQYPGRKGHRAEQFAKSPFNLIALDVENSVTIEAAKLLLKDYTFFLYTTKRHTDAAHRFRVVLPISHVLNLETKDYRQFISNIHNWLPFEVDPTTRGRSQKWESNPGQCEYNRGKLLDVFPFIPNTKKAEETESTIQKNQQKDLTKLEQWFVVNAAEGNRNKMLFRYAMMLVDLGHEYSRVQTKVLDLNSKLDDPLDPTEIMTTIMGTVGRTIDQKTDKELQE